MKKQYNEWDFDDWENGWNIKVGKVYICEKCKNTVMVSKGGTGVMKLICCDEEMKEFSGEKR